MATKRQRVAVAKKGAIARKRNMLLREGWTEREIDDRRLDRKSFGTKRVRSLRENRRALVDDAMTSGRFAHIRSDEVRREVAVAYAQRVQFDPVQRFSIMRRERLLSDGLTAAEAERFSGVRSNNVAMKETRRRRRAEIRQAIRELLPRGARTAQAVRIAFDAKGDLFLRARDRVWNLDRRRLASEGKDYPHRLLDLYRLGA